MRTFHTKLALVCATFVFGSSVLIAELLGRPRGPGTMRATAARRWARWIARAAGMRVVTHGLDGLDTTRSYVYVANHVSIMDIPAVLVALPDHGLVAKRELSRIPLFGAAARAAGIVYIDRENRKSAFAAYDEAADQVRGGRSVVVFPEGTRGETYALRPFKKGPFVLAIRAGVPIVPVVIHGTIEITPNGTLHVTPGTVDVHLLEPIPTAGLTYDDRNALADLVQSRMADAMATHHRVSPTLAPPAVSRAHPSLSSSTPLSA